MHNAAARTSEKQTTDKQTGPKDLAAAAGQRHAAKGKARDKQRKEAASPSHAAKERQQRRQNLYNQRENKKDGGQTPRGQKKGQQEIAKQQGTCTKAAGPGRAARGKAKDTQRKNLERGGGPEPRHREKTP